MNKRTRRIDNDLSTLSFVFLREWTERRPTGWFFGPGCIGLLRAGGERERKKSVANGIDSIGSVGILVLLLLLLHKERDQT